MFLQTMFGANVGSQTLRMMCLWRADGTAGFGQGKEERDSKDKSRGG